MQFDRTTDKQTATTEALTSEDLLTKANDFANSTLKDAENVSLNMAETASTVEAISQAVSDQFTTVKELEERVSELTGSMRNIESSGRETKNVTTQANQQLENSRTTIDEATVGIKSLTEAVSNIEERLGKLETSLGAVGKIAAQIQGIAGQTNLLALNATIEAARAGEAGKGFAVVAGEVKALAGQTAKATDEINSTVKDLTDQVSNLVKDSTLAIERASEVNSEVETIHQALDQFAGSFESVERQVDSISEASSSSLQHCDVVGQEMETMVTTFAATTDNLMETDKQITAALGHTESLINSLAQCGFETDDTIVIDEVIKQAEAISSLFEGAVKNGEISMADLFDESYQPIAGSNPEQYMVRFVNFTDKVLPKIQEPMLVLDTRVVFSAAVDRNAFLPTHNTKISKPQGNDPVWNNANCRNRRIFNDRTGANAGANTKRLLVQTYRRDMGGGKYVLMKDISSAIYVQGRHWGALRLGLAV